MATARNRALDVLRRERTARHFAPEMGRLLESEWTTVAAVDEAFTDHIIRDEQLRMMFSCCQPRLPEPVQVALMLNILCGFGAGEIAAAFLAGRAAVEKRIARGKKALAASRRLFELTSAEFHERLPVVRRALYLLFNEGYHGAFPGASVRADLCDEAIRLTALLSEHPRAVEPETNALAALMCLHAARLPARMNPAGDLNPFFEQDRSRWDARLVAKGLWFFDRSTSGDELTGYHLEAAIAVAHASAKSGDATDWTTIVALYDRLMAIAPSPVVALNRAIAVAQRDGAERGLEELRAIANRERLGKYPFYWAAMADLELRSGRAGARAHFAAALALARTAPERAFLERRFSRAHGAEKSHGDDEKNDLDGSAAPLSQTPS
jgi:predicted RNA polymerase sigma factor